MLLRCCMLVQADGDGRSAASAGAAGRERALHGADTRRRQRAGHRRPVS